MYHILDSTYKWYHIFALVWLTSISMIISRSIHVAANHIFILFYGWVLFYCVYIHTPHLLYPFICQWTFTLLPCLFGYCKWCCYENGVHVFFQIKVFSRYLSSSGMLNHMVAFIPTIGSFHSNPKEGLCQRMFKLP